MTIIDLGEVTDTDFVPPRRPGPRAAAADPPDHPGRGRAAHRGHRHRVGPDRTAAALRPLWTIATGDADMAYLAGDTVLVDRTTGNRATLTAYDAATGAPRWTADSGSASGYPDLLTSSGVLLQPVAYTELRASWGTISFTGTTAALDAATGARLWQMNASPVHAVGDNVLMTERDARGEIARLRLVRQRDGGTIWTRALVANGAVAVSDDAVVTIDDHGTTTVLRWADGSVLRTGTVPWTPDRMPDGVHNDVGIAGPS